MYRVIYKANAEPIFLCQEGMDHSFSQIVICLQPKTQPGVLKLKILEFAFLISDSFLVRIRPDMMFQRK